MTDSGDGVLKKKTTNPKKTPTEYFKAHKKIMGNDNTVFLMELYF